MAAITEVHIVPIFGVLDTPGTCGPTRYNRSRWAAVPRVTGGPSGWPQSNGTGRVVIKPSSPAERRYPLDIYEF